MGNGLNYAETEEWRTLPEHSGYLISSLGRVMGPRGAISLRPNKNGYITFSYEIQGRRFTIGLHQVVCRLFNGEAPQDKPFALHNNHTRSDCRASNLHWGSHQDNMDERNQAGRNKVKVPQEVVDEIRQRHELGESQNSLAKHYGLSQVYVGKVVNNLTRRVQEVIDVA